MLGLSLKGLFQPKRFHHSIPQPPSSLLCHEEEADAFILLLHPSIPSTQDEGPPPQPGPLPPRLLPDHPSNTRQVSSARAATSKGSAGPFIQRSPEMSPSLAQWPQGTPKSPWMMAGVTSPLSPCSLQSPHSIHLTVTFSPPHTEPFSQPPPSPKSHWDGVTALAGGPVPTPVLLALGPPPLSPGKGDDALSLFLAPHQSSSGPREGCGAASSGGWLW